MRYTYLGSKWTAPELIGMQCDPVKDRRGKCIVNIALAHALVIDVNGKKYNVSRRRLRLNEIRQPA